MSTGHRGARSEIARFRRAIINETNAQNGVDNPESSAGVMSTPPAGRPKICDPILGRRKRFLPSTKLADRLLRTTSLLFREKRHVCLAAYRSPPHSAYVKTV
jgi:hypothetical protein